MSLAQAKNIPAEACCAYILLLPIYGYPELSGSYAITYSGTADPSVRSRALKAHLPDMLSGGRSVPATPMNSVLFRYNGDVSMLNYNWSNFTCNIGKHAKINTISKINEKAGQAAQKHWDFGLSEYTRLTGNIFPVGGTKKTCIAQLQQGLLKTQQEFNSNRRAQEIATFYAERTLVCPIRCTNMQALNREVDPSPEAKGSLYVSRGIYGRIETTFHRIPMESKSRIGGVEPWQFFQCYMEQPLVHWLRNFSVNIDNNSGVSIFGLPNSYNFSGYLGTDF